MKTKRITVKTIKIKNNNFIGNIYENDYVIPIKKGEDKMFYAATGLDFSQALAALKAGKKVTREEWGKIKHLVLTKESVIKMEEMPLFVRSEIENHIGIKGVDSYTTHAHIDMILTHDGVDIITWTPSQDDLLKEDWCIIS